MKFGKLLEDMQEQIDALKHGALTIQADLLDALESAGVLEEYQSQVENCLDEIIGEAQSVRRTLSIGKRSVMHD
jgi:hypothetical protein